MEGNQSSRVSNAGATRKRRSSILKSQRPPRTPFSELEFNVATPTDATKSRRVSFSRKTGVAEFATNEATTTWKNFYEEQNKSLESSGHDADRPPRPSVLGNRLFDQQFQEVEAEIDFGSFAPNTMGPNISLNNANITQQIAMLESADEKLTAPSNKFELSAFTETNSKIMNNLTNPTFCADSGRIDVNFSNLNTLGSSHGANDDLDEIERDLEISRPNIVGPAYTGEVSQYIEFDLNGTQGPLRGNESDMSITDTIHSPKKEVSKSISITDRSWVDDKENIIVNPYVTPSEADNFAVNDETSQVLVFDGKSLKYADINADLDEVVEDVRKSTVKTKADVQPKRQTIVFESQDAEISMTQCIPNLPIKSNNTIVFHEDDIADMSVTQAVPNHVNYMNPVLTQKRQTIVFATDDIDADVSITQAIPNKILSQPTKRQTIVFGNDEADISMTQCIPNAVISKSNTTLFEGVQSEKEDPQIQQKRQTIVFTNDDIDADISMTQAIPTNILSKSLKQENSESECKQPKRQTIVFGNEDLEADVSMTQAIPSNILGRRSIKPEILETLELQPKRQTIVFANDDLDADISMTQSIPSNILSRKSLKPEIVGSTSDQPDTETMVPTTDHINTDISMTQAIPTNILSRKSLKPEIFENIEVNPKRQTVVFANDDLDAEISMTQSIPTNILSRQSLKPEISENKNEQTKRQTIVFACDDDDDDADISVTQAVPNNVLKQSIGFIVNETQNQNMSSVKQEVDLSMTEDDIKSVTDKRKSLKTESISEQPKRKTVDFINTQNDDSLHHSKQNIHERSNLFKTEDTFSYTKEHLSNPSIKTKRDSIISNEEPNYFIDKSNICKENLNLSPPQKMRQSFKPETLVYTLTTTMDSPENNIAVPSSKGDDFHASSQQIDLDKQAGLENPQTTSHSYKAPKVSTKRPADQVESKFEAAINSISYDNMVSSSTKIVNEPSESKMSLTDDDNPNKESNSSESKSQVSEVSVSKSDVESKKSVLNELLDMSCASLPDGFEDKDVMAKPDIDTYNHTEPVLGENLSAMDLDITSNTKLAEVEEISTKDSNEDKESMQDKPSNNSMFLIMRDSEDNFQPQLGEMNRTTDTKDFDVKTETEAVEENFNLDKKLDKLLQRNESPKSYSQDLFEDRNDNNSKIELDKSQGIATEERESNKSRMQQNISRKSFKDADDTRELLEILSNLTDKTVCNDKSPRKSVGVSKSDQTKRLTFALDVESVKDSKETLSEALSKNSELDEEYEPDTPAPPSKKAIRLSHDVVKTLQYEDDTVETKTNRSPLKKTAFGETSYMNDKTRVIPSFANASDGIKELMDDLVKPMADVIVPLPTRADKSINKDTSTCSTQIQANLMRSSQVDLELCSTSSNYDVLRNLASDVAFEANQSVSRALKDTVCLSETSSLYKEGAEKRVTESEQIIIFDRNNPLNNVILAPTDFANAHSYNPDTESYRQEFDVERVSLKFDHERLEPLPNIVEENSSVKSEHSIQVTEVIDSEVNTDIAMKANKELLEASSSLTLVEGNFDTDMDVDGPKQNTSVKVIYQLDEIILDDEVSRKRNYSPTKQRNTSNLELTPKPMSKVQRLSNSPISVSLSKKSPEAKSPRRSIENRLSPTGKSTESPTRKPIQNRTSPTRKSIENRQSSPRKLHEHKLSPTRRSPELYKKPNTVVTVQHMAAEYGNEGSISDDVISCASSNDQGAKETASILSSESRSSPTSLQDKSRRQGSDKNSKFAVGDTESSGNVVTKIDMLPCMGTKLCEWDTSGAAADSLSFRLLHGRVRVSFRLAHRLDNASRSHVRAGTRVVACTVRAMLSDTSPTDIRKVIPTLSVQFAAAAMRALLADVARAADVPAALRRCAGVADSAHRWAARMYEAHSQLAFSLDVDGRLALKVCNLPLSSVWDVRMHLALSSSSTGLPYPQASAVSAASVVGEPPTGVEEAAAAAPRDWGHAPLTIWKVFRHLKNKKGDVALSLV